MRRIVLGLLVTFVLFRPASASAQVLPALPGHDPMIDVLPPSWVEADVQQELLAYAPIRDIATLRHDGLGSRA